MFACRPCEWEPDRRYAGTRCASVIQPTSFCPSARWEQDGAPDHGKENFMLNIFVFLGEKKILSKEQEEKVPLGPEVQNEGPDTISDFNEEKYFYVQRPPTFPLF